MNLSNSQTKPVWDIAIRIFHWSLVTGFTTAYLTGEDDDSLLHIYSGYVVLALILFRIVWGLVGSRHARFKDFIYSPRQSVAYAKRMISGKPEHYDGHNPLGSWMVFALLICLLATTITGLKVYGIEGHGPLAASAHYSEVFIKTAQGSTPIVEMRTETAVDKKQKHYWEEIHEFFANLTVFLVVLHVGGVVLSSRLEKQNLVKAMLTGRKQVLSQDK